MIGVMPLVVMAAGQAGRLRAAGLTYREAGQTAGVLPPGYHHLRRSAVIGSGAQVFTAAAAALFSWQAHLRAGLRVSATSATAGPGTVALLGLGTGRLWMTAPVRVVYAVTEPDRRGFAYGTLAGHPERGEEAFLITLSGEGTVTFTITAFSTPATPLAKATGPAGRAIQHHITTRYLRALAS
jgi:uncharacterized protein (UPF0548 family)